jgi:hypothetical protein
VRHPTCPTPGCAASVSWTLWCDHSPHPRRYTDCPARPDSSRPMTSR